MRFRPLSSRLWAAVLASGLTLAAPAHALEDVLQTPAIHSAKASQTLLLDLVQAGDRLVAVGQRGHIIYSDDNGRSWKQGNVPVSTLLTAVHFPTAKHGWAVGHGGVVLHSKDGGQTWEKQLDGLQVNTQVIAQNERTVQDLEARLESAADEELDELERRLEEAQMNLDDSRYDAEDGPGKPFLDVWFKNDQEGFVVGAYGLFFATVDGGKTWVNYGNRLKNPYRLHLNGVAGVTGGTLFIVGESGHVHRSTDRGASWQLLESPYDGSLFAVTGTGNVNEVLIMGLRGHMFRSENLGASWQAVKTGVTETLTGGTFGDDGQVTVVGNSGVVLSSRNFGQTFDAFVRADRVSLAGAAVVKDGRLLVVGEEGVVRTDATGKNL